MGLELVITPEGRLRTEWEGEPAGGVEGRLWKAFEAGEGAGLLLLGGALLESAVPADFGFVRELAREYMTRACHVAAYGTDAIAAPEVGQLEALALKAGPMKGLEYLTAGVLAKWWEALDAHARKLAVGHAGGPGEWLRSVNGAWNVVGRVTLHLAENKRNPDYPFAFMATYVGGLSAQGAARHQPLGKALEEYAGAQNKAGLLKLLEPLERAAKESKLIAEMVKTGAIYRPQAWTAGQAYGFLKSMAGMEASGLALRVPDWWKASKPVRAQVQVTVGKGVPSGVGLDALVDFDINIVVDGQGLSEEEIQAILKSSERMVSLRGKWVEVDREKLGEAVAHWKKVEKEAAENGVSLFEAMRMLSGFSADGLGAAGAAEMSVREWTGITAGAWLGEVMENMRRPGGVGEVPGLNAKLRPYQKQGVEWLYLTHRLGLGACLADDMGLGKTIQFLSLLLLLKRDREARGGVGPGSLLVAPASLLGNWRAEAERFSPGLSVAAAHPSQMEREEWERVERHGLASGEGEDLVITTYGMAHRLGWLKEKKWRVVALDEAQAIKNPGTRQSRAVKELKAVSRVALTGTPVENRLGDLWSLFDFVNPGLLGTAKEFTGVSKAMAKGEVGYGPLRSLISPYILRRLKTDKSIIDDLPDKTEVSAYCMLGVEQAGLYAKGVEELKMTLETVEPKSRRGVVLAFLMRFKQICNHPSQWLGDGGYEMGRSGKFARLTEVCEPIAERQEKVLVFTQFKEMTRPIAAHLEKVMGAQGLVLDGDTPVGKRRELVEAFQKDGGPAFFVLSLKAGGTGLNLTRASHVVHFDRWWNPAVENQATDRAFRIGQKRNVLVHKFVCQGTLEEKIDEMIRGKAKMAEGVLTGEAEKALTEMSDEELVKFVSLDLRAVSEM
jgi:superfamily II DNA or RNA helicase